MNAYYVNEHGHVECAHCGFNYLHPEATFLSIGHDANETQLCITGTRGHENKSRPHFMVRPSNEDVGRLITSGLDMSICTVFYCEGCHKFTKIGLSVDRGHLQITYDGVHESVEKPAQGYSYFEK